MIFIWIRKMAWCEHTFPCSLYFLEYDRQPKLVDTTLPSFPALQAFLKNMFHFVLPSLCVYTYLQAYVWTSTQENIRQFSSLKKKNQLLGMQTKFFRRLSLPISLSILLLNDFVEKSLWQGSKKSDLNSLFSSGQGERIIQTKIGNYDQMTMLLPGVMSRLRSHTLDTVFSRFMGMVFKLICRECQGSKAGTLQVLHRVDD